MYKFLHEANYSKEFMNTGRVVVVNNKVCIQFNFVTIIYHILNFFIKIKITYMFNHILIGEKYLMICKKK